MATVIQTDLTIIAQAVEQQLLTYVDVLTTAAQPAGSTGNAVVNDLSNIYWVERGHEPPPGQTGQRDVILEFWQDQAEWQRGGGPPGTVIAAGMDIYLRTTLALDKRGTRRDWFINNRPYINALMSALYGSGGFSFFPQDASGNALTVEGFVLQGNSSPERMSGKAKDALTWGYVVSSYAFHYMPSMSFGAL